MSNVDSATRPAWRNRLYERESGWRVLAGVVLTLGTWWFPVILPAFGIAGALLLVALVALLARRVGWTRWTARVSTWALALAATLNGLRVLNGHSWALWFVVIAELVFVVLTRFAWWVGLRIAYRGQA